MTNEQSWEPCRTGEITAMVDRGRRARRAQSVSRLASATVGVAVLIGVCALWFTSSTGYEFGGITCRECMSNAEAYYADEIADPDLRESIRVHLRDCPKCHPHVEEFERALQTSVARVRVVVMR